MRSHYVPKMYLKGWQTVYNNRQKQICVYKKGQKPEFKSIREVAWREDYYTEEAEARLDRELESKTEPVLKKVIQEKSLTESEREQLALFMFVLWWRVPFNLEGLFRQIREATLAATIKDMERLRDSLKHLNLPDKVFDFEKYKSPEHEKLVYSELLLHNKYQQHKAFQRMNWRFFKAAPGEEFVTSDNPVFFDRRFGLSDSMFSFFICPISKHLLLMGRLSNMPGKDFEPISADKTDWLNRLIIRNCDQDVYASVNNTDIARLVNECAGEARLIKHVINVKFE